MTAQAQISTLPFRSIREKNECRNRSESDAVIAIVDDDLSVRQGLERLIRSLGWTSAWRKWTVTFEFRTSTS